MRRLIKVETTRSSVTQFSLAGLTAPNWVGAVSLIWRSSLWQEVSRKKIIIWSSASSDTWRSCWGAAPSTGRATRCWSWVPEERGKARWGGGGGWWRCERRLTASVFAQLLRSVLQELLQEKEVQENLLQVHLNGNQFSESGSDLLILVFIRLLFCLFQASYRPTTELHLKK